MSDPKVIYMKSASSSSASVTPSPKSLFGDPASAFGHVAFLKIDTMDQGRFIRLLGKNAVSAIVDLRASPVFSRPRFQHAEIADYLFTRRIAYLDLTSQGSRASIYDAMINNLASQPHEMVGRVAELMDRGLTLILYDDVSEQSGSVADIRKFLRHHGSYRAEVHPNALSID